MSIALLVAAWRDGPDDPRARLLLMALADGANPEGIGRMPPLDELADRSCCSGILQVHYVLDALAARGVLKPSSAAGKGLFALDVDRLTTAFQESDP